MDADMTLIVLRWLGLALNREELSAGDGMAVPVPATLARVPAMGQQQENRDAQILQGQSSLMSGDPLPSD
jgi:hypothetical protein